MFYFRNIQFTLFCTFIVKVYCIWYDNNFTFCINILQGKKGKVLDMDKLSEVIAHARDTLKVTTSREFFEPTNFDQIVMKLPGAAAAAPFGVAARHKRRWRSNLKNGEYADLITQGKTFQHINYIFQLRPT
jgi:hypothetical protein